MHLERVRALNQSGCHDGTVLEMEAQLGEISVIKEDLDVALAENLEATHEVESTLRGGSKALRMSLAYLKVPIDICEGNIFVVQGYNSYNPRS